jgi:type I restriction enzyme R subunit
VKVLDAPLANDGGTLNLLRGGFKVGSSARLDMSYPRPATSLNPKAAELYGKTRLRVMRQVHFATSGNQSVDLVLLINGIPVATVELKTDFTQTVEDAIEQYRARDVRSSPLFGWGSRAIVHFAVSNAEVWMTTKLEGKGTRFLPFNRGDNGRAGNPPNPAGSATSYLWEQVLDKDAWLDIVLRFAHVETANRLDANGRPTRTSTLIFPRFHQWEAVTNILADARGNGAGQSYLIEHSAGSGKTRTIAWTAHRLLSLHDESDAKIFDSVIVVTDRTVLDDQLQAAVRQIERTTGTVLAIDKQAMGAYGVSSKSQLLRDGLLGGKKIIVVTLQTFPAVLQLLNGDATLAGRRYAVIADEAHSSQTGSAATKLKKVLTPPSRPTWRTAGRWTPRRCCWPRWRAVSARSTSASWRSLPPRRPRRSTCSAALIQRTWTRAGTLSRNRFTSTRCSKPSRRASSSMCFEISPITTLPFSSPSRSSKAIRCWPAKARETRRCSSTSTPPPRA